MYDTVTIRIPANLGSNGPQEFESFLFLQITEAKGGEVHVNMEDHKEEEFKRPKVHLTLDIGRFKHTAPDVYGFQMVESRLACKWNSKTCYRCLILFLAAILH